MQNQEEEFPKAYEPSNETKWYDYWLRKGFFSANKKSEKPSYCIVMPPPNVTGALHMGHALVSTIQDILVRWKRMNGYNTLWIPGTDHAGISTQTVVERHLMMKHGKKRTDYSREDFLAHVWAWKEEKQDRILTQLKRVGSSCDWDKLRFTMDDGNNQAVRAMFKKLFDAGLIYRGNYLVNWDPITQTALADDEVEHEERTSSLWYFRYPLADQTGFVTVATTRPETMLGDTAIAVAPSDTRFAHLIGKTVLHPFQHREIPIIADHRIDPAFGTGAVKITPAHDFLDYQIGQQHKLPLINIMTADGRINENGGNGFEGLTMLEARQVVVEKLDELKLLEKIDPHTLRVGVSYRSKAVIEPYMSKQWFVKTEAFVEKLRNAVNEGKVKLIPKMWESVYFHWINNLRDWCISRQLWWGHRIPIWYHVEDPLKMICYDGIGVPEEVAKAPHLWVQDNDVLDTWFSSGLWPFSTLGWPEQTDLLKTFYPNSVLVTGYDILFFWVARMLMLGEYAMGEFPFPDVFLHGLIYGKSYWRNNPKGGITYVSDEERLSYDMGKPVPEDVFSRWEKMSKSKGNIIDPVEILETYGTDAMRMALCASSPQGREIDLDRRRFEEFKNFANKVWNGARFVLMNAGGLTSQEFSKGLNESILALEDRWILSVLNRTIKNVNSYLETYTFDLAATEAYDFFWKEFCAYYVEIAKPILTGKIGSEQDRTNKQKILYIVITHAILLLHPMAPFITEELFQRIKNYLPGLSAIETADPYTKSTVKALLSEACIIAPFPTVLRASDQDASIEQTFDLVGQIVYTIRNLRGEMKLPPSTLTDVCIIGKNEDPKFQIVQKNHSIISALVKVGKIDFMQEQAHDGLSATGVIDELKIVIPLPQELIQKEKQRLEKEQDKLIKSIEKLKNQLDNEDFVSRAPPELIAKQRDQLRQNQNELDEIHRKLTFIE